MVMAGIHDIEIRHLEALRAVAEEGTFGRAATRLGFSQAAISAQIGALEKAVGEPVFDRPGGPRPVALTPAGRLLLGHAEAIIDRLGVAEVELDALRTGEGGRLVVGTFQSVSVQVLPAVLGALRAQAPDLEVRLFESDDDEELARRVVDESLDLSFLIGPRDHPDLEVVELCRDPFVALLPADDPRAERPDRPLRALDLDGAPLIGQQDCACQRLIDGGLRDLGVCPEYVFRTNDNAAVQAMVRAGMGAAVMPRMAVDARDPGVRVMTMNPPLAPRQILVATRKDRTVSAAARRFIDLAVRTSVRFTA